MGILHPNDLIFAGITSHDVPNTWLACAPVRLNEGWEYLMVVHVMHSLNCLCWAYLTCKCTLVYKLWFFRHANITHWAHIGLILFARRFPGLCSSFSTRSVFFPFVQAIWRCAYAIYWNDLCGFGLALCLYCYKYSGVLAVKSFQRWRLKDLIGYSFYHDTAILMRVLYSKSGSVARLW